MDQIEIEIEDKALISEFLAQGEVLMIPYVGGTESTSNTPPENNEESTVNEHVLEEVSSANQGNNCSKSSRTLFIIQNSSRATFTYERILLILKHRMLVQGI